MNDGKVITHQEDRSKQDRSVKRYKAMLETDPVGGEEEGGCPNQGTYRTLMT